MIWVYRPDGTTLESLPKRAPMVDAATMGVRIGILDNRKANAGLLMREVSDRLAGRLGGTTHYFAKSNASLAAPVPLLEEIAGEVDLVLTGSAD
jgi:hypothetical protein